MAKNSVKGREGPPRDWPVALPLPLCAPILASAAGGLSRISPCGSREVGMGGAAPSDYFFPQILFSSFREIHLY